MKDVYFTIEGEELTPVEVARLLNVSDYVVLFYILGETEKEYFRFGKFVSLSREIKAKDIRNIILNVLVADNRCDIFDDDILNLCIVGVTNDSYPVFSELNPSEVWPSFEEMTCVMLSDKIHGLKNDGENDVQ